MQENGKEIEEKPARRDRRKFSLLQRHDFDCPANTETVVDIYNRNFANRRIFFSIHIIIHSYI